MYNFDDPIEYGDDAAKSPTNDEKTLGVYHNVTEGDVVMHYASHGDDHGAGFGTNYADTASIMIMLQDIHMK